MGAAGPGGPEEGGSGAESPEEGCASVVALSRWRPNLARDCTSVASPGFRFCVFPSLSPYLFFYFSEEVQISGVVGGRRKPVSGCAPPPPSVQPAPSSSPPLRWSVLGAGADGLKCAGSEPI